MKASLWISCALFLTACGDNDETDPGEPEPDPPPAPVVFVPPTPVALTLSAAGPDQLQSVVAGPGGTFYVGGFAGAAATGPFRAVVAQVNAAGALVPSFGIGGVVTTDLVVPGTADEVDLAVQSDGKLLVGATVLSSSAPPDRDVVVLRLTAAGQVDTTFGDNGVRVLDLSTTGGGSTVMDSLRALAVGAGDAIFLHGGQKAEGTITGGSTPRVDSDFYVVKLTSQGAVDASWGTSGKHLQDIYLSATHSNAVPRFVRPLPDGSLLAGGYSNAIGTVQPVVYKLSASGAPVTAFASGGLFHDTVLAVQTEVYNVAIHGDKVVTGGYGRQSGTINDWVSLRFDVNTGARDATWGGATGGAVLFDPSGAMLGSNLRSTVALPDGKTLLVGSTGPANMATQDAVFAVLDNSGKLDTKYGTGIVKYPFGSNGNDQLWGVAISGDKVMMVGHKGGLAALAMQTAGQNDDSYLVPLSVQ